VWGDTSTYYGVWGSSVSNDGVHGNSQTLSGVFGGSVKGDGVNGQSSSTTGGVAVRGIGAGTTWGVVGNSGTGNGVYGQSAGAGVWGESTGYDAVHGHTSNPNNNTSGVAGFGDGGNTGVFGISTSGTGVTGTTTSGNGVFGHSNTGYGMATDGAAQQARSQGGWVKAMVDVDPQNERIVHCFNSALPANSASIPPCGFSLQEPQPGETIIDFGFEVDDRFFSVLPYSAGHDGRIGVTLGSCKGSPNIFCNAAFPTPNQVSLQTFDGDGNSPNAELHVIVF
jgi:hypothetical protein